MRTIKERIERLERMMKVDTVPAVWGEGEITTAELIRLVVRVIPDFNRNVLNGCRSKHLSVRPSKRIGNVLLWPMSMVDEIIQIKKGRTE